MTVWCYQDETILQAAIVRPLPTRGRRVVESCFSCAITHSHGKITIVEIDFFFLFWASQQRCTSVAPSIKSSF
jgi:hypothetical protein